MLKVEARGPVRHLILSRPEARNALDGETLAALVGALAEAPATGARVIVLAGEGEHFSAGADLAEVAAASDPAERRQVFGRVARAIAALAACPLPVVAKVRGYCLAGAMGLVAAADFAYAEAGARFGLPEVQVGLFPMVVSAPLSRLLRPRLLADLALTGRRLSAAEALEAGLLTGVAPDGEALEELVAEKVAALAALSPEVLARGKRALAWAREMPLLEGMAVLETLVADLAGTAAAEEGIRAFFEKRKPSWS
jgi:methylglutaconyl-CoA hydratase